MCVRARVCVLCVCCVCCVCVCVCVCCVCVGEVLVACVRRARDYVVLLRRPFFLGNQMSKLVLANSCKSSFLVLVRKIRLIEEAAGKPPRDPTARLPWRTLLCSPILNGQYVWNTSANWMFYQLLTFLPQYMTQVLQFDITKAGVRQQRNLDVRLPPWFEALAGSKPLLFL